MNKTCRPRTTRPLAASTSLKLRICVPRSPLATRESWARIFVSNVTNWRGLESSSRSRRVSSRSWYTSINHSHASSGLSDDALISSLTAVFHFLQFSGLGNSGNFNESASLTFGAPPFWFPPNTWSNAALSKPSANASTFGCLDDDGCPAPLSPLLLADPCPRLGWYPASGPSVGAVPLDLR